MSTETDLSELPPELYEHEIDVPMNLAEAAVLISILEEAIEAFESVALTTKQHAAIAPVLKLYGDVYVRIKRLADEKAKAIDNKEPSQ